MDWRKIFHKIGLKKMKEKGIVDKIEDLDLGDRSEYIKEIKLVADLEENITNIKGLLGNSADLSFRRFEAGPERVKGVLIFLNGLTNSQAVTGILRILEIEFLKLESVPGEKKHIYHTVKERLINTTDVSEDDKLESILTDIITGDTALIFDQTPRAIICGTRGYKTRSLKEPDEEVTLQGPKLGFIEELYTNTSLLRRFFKTPHLWMQSVELGELTKTKVVIAYIKGLASEELVDEVKYRIKNIQMDSVFGDSYIKENIHDESLTFFPLIRRTQRPDIVAANLVEGRIAILTDGTPFVLIAPATFAMFFQSPDDYYELFLLSSFKRGLRFLAFFFSLLLPGIYVAILNYHPELLPTSLLLRIAATREGVPFPIIIESLFMETVFEILREAGLRLPKSIGSTVSIVGGLVLGQAAIQASLVSPPMVMVVAITAISSFTIPSYEFGLAARLFRFVFIFLGATIGLFGIQFGILILLIHLSALRSFGQPYFQPFGPLIWQDWKDALVRLPWWKMILRPKLTGAREPQRVKKGQEPKPPAESQPRKGRDEDKTGKQTTAGKQPEEGGIVKSQRKKGNQNEER